MRRQAERRLGGVDGSLEHGAKEFGWRHFPAPANERLASHRRLQEGK
jgi:hypothetical protein